MSLLDDKINKVLNDKQQKIYKTVIDGSIEDTTNLALQLRQANIQKAQQEQSFRMQLLQGTNTSNPDLVNTQLDASGATDRFNKIQSGDSVGNLLKSGASSLISTSAGVANTVLRGIEGTANFATGSDSSTTPEWMKGLIRDTGKVSDKRYTDKALGVDTTVMDAMNAKARANAKAQGYTDLIKSDNMTDKVKGTVGTVWESLKAGMAHPLTTFVDSSGEMALMAASSSAKLGGAVINKLYGTVAGTKIVNTAKSIMTNPTLTAKALKGSLSVAKDVGKLAKAGSVVSLAHLSQVNQKAVEVQGKPLDLKTSLVYMTVDSVLSGADLSALKYALKPAIGKTTQSADDILRISMIEKLKQAAIKDPTVLKKVAAGALGIGETLTKSGLGITAGAGNEAVQEFLQESHDWAVAHKDKQFAALTAEALNDIAVGTGMAASVGGAVKGTVSAPGTVVKVGTTIAKTAYDTTKTAIDNHNLKQAAIIVDNDHLDVKDQNNKTAIDTLNRTTEENKEFFKAIVSSKDIAKTVDELKSKYPDKAKILDDVMKVVKADSMNPQQIKLAKQALLKAVLPPDTTVEDTQAKIETLTDKIDNFNMEEGKDKTLNEVVSDDTKNLLGHILDKTKITKNGKPISLDELLTQPVTKEALSTIKTAIESYNKDLTEVLDENDPNSNKAQLVEDLAIKYGDKVSKGIIDNHMNKPLEGKAAEDFKITMAKLLKGAATTNNYAIGAINQSGRAIRKGKKNTKPVKIGKSKVTNDTSNTDIIEALYEADKVNHTALAANLSLDKLAALKDAIDAIEQKGEKGKEEQVKKAKEVLTKAMNTKIDAYNKVFGKANETLTDDNIDFGNDVKLDPEVFKGENSLDGTDTNPTKTYMNKVSYAKIGEKAKPTKGNIPSENLFKEVLKNNLDATETDVIGAYGTNPVEAAENLVKEFIGKDVTLSEDEANRIIKEVEDAMYYSKKDKDGESTFILLLHDGLSRLGIKAINEEIGGDKAYSKFEEAIKIYNKLSGKNKVNTDITFDNVYGAVRNKQPNLSEDNHRKIANYIMHMVSTKPHLLHHPILDPILEAFTGDKQYKNDKEFYDTITNHINRQYKALVNNTNKARALDDVTVNAVKGQLEAFKHLIEEVRYSLEDDVKNVPTEDEVKMLDTYFRLLELTTNRTGATLDDIISVVKETAKEVAEATKEEWNKENTDTKSEEDTDTPMEYAVLNEKPDEKTLKAIYEKLDKAGMIC